MNEVVTYQKAMDKFHDDLTFVRVYLVTLWSVSRPWRSTCKLERGWIGSPYKTTSLRSLSVILFNNRYVPFGHGISGFGVNVDDRKIEKMEQIKLLSRTPYCLRLLSAIELRSFLGSANYYFRLIRVFSDISTLLNTATSTKTGFIWNKEVVESFMKVINVLVTPLAITYRMLVFLDSERREEKMRRLTPSNTRS